MQVIAPKSPTAHPRACGENSPLGKYAGSPVGSSPRMRGKLHNLPRATGDSGLIPAHAGKTARGGEEQNAHGGSSPRMRGKHRLGYRSVLYRRLIPAHAGKTVSRRRLN